MSDAKLVGRGGAAFPTGIKWEAVARNPVRPHYVVCNADESEPGTFKDRVLMEEDPFALVEAMTIAGFAAARSRASSTSAASTRSRPRRLAHAIAEARAAGLLGADILGAGCASTSRSAAAPAPTSAARRRRSSTPSRASAASRATSRPSRSVGLFGKPTAVNNVETLVNVLEVLRAAARRTRRSAPPESTGTRLFCLCGCVAVPGLYEVPFGVTLARPHRRSPAACAGGRPLQAVLLGGAAGAFVGPDELGVPLTFEDARAAARRSARAS